MSRSLRSNKRKKLIKSLIGRVRSATKCLSKAFNSEIHLGQLEPQLRTRRSERKVEHLRITSIKPGRSRRTGLHGGGKP